MGQMVNIVLASILVNEVLGPPLTKFALEASGSTRKKRKALSGPETDVTPTRLGEAAGGTNGAADAPTRTPAGTAPEDTNDGGTS